MVFGIPHKALKSLICLSRVFLKNCYYPWSCEKPFLFFELLPLAVLKRDPLTGKLDIEETFTVIF